MEVGSQMTNEEIVNDLLAPTVENIATWCLVAQRRVTLYKHHRLSAFKRIDLDAWATSDSREAIK